MAVPTPVKSHSNSVWTVYGHNHLQTCPGCGRDEGLEYVGYNHNYSAGLCAKIYQCTHCNTWTDVIRSKNPTPARIGKPRPKKNLGFVSV